jgi:carbon monoxide dehydrogenase subunit G
VINVRPEFQVRLEESVAMTYMEHSIVINATPEEIDAFANDPSRWPEWYPGIVQTQTEGNYPEPGSVVNMEYKATGTTFNFTYTSLEYMPGQSLRAQMEGMVTGVSTYTYIPEADGTRITGSFEYEIPGGVLGKIADKLVLERMNDTNLRDSLANLKAAMEG